MTTKLIERRICLNPENLTIDIMDDILLKVKEITKNECTKDDGYILDVNRILRIKDNYISNANCDTVFIVEFEAVILKPKNGEVFSGEVCMIFAGGIFLNVKNKQKILVSKSSLSDYTFDQVNKTFKNKETVIKEKSILDVIVTGTKYSKQSFSCFGTLV